MIFSLRDGSGIRLVEYITAELRLSVVSSFSCVVAELILEGNIWHDHTSCVSRVLRAESDGSHKVGIVLYSNPKDFSGGYMALWGPC